MRIKFGITEKLITVMFALIVVLMVASSYYSFKYQKELLLSQFDERARAMVDSLATSSEYPVLTGNEKLLADIGGALLSRDDVVFCEVKDKDGKTLFKGRTHKAVKSIREYVASVTTEKVFFSPDEVVLLDSEGKKLEKIGEIRLALSLDRVTQEMERQKNIISGLALVGILIILISISLLIKLILGKPIRELLKGTQELALGNLQYRVPFTSHDEIGALASSFNKMTEDLQGITVSRDSLVSEINERKKVEEEREKLIKKLEEGQELLKRQKREAEDSRRAIKNVAEDLKESKEILEYQKRSLEDVNKELDDFTYIVSHDLKEPLRSIDAYSKFIGDDYQAKLDEEGIHYLERIRVNTERMKKLIEDLLEISRLKRKGSTIEEAEVGELIAEVKMRLEYTIKEKGVEIVIKDKLPKIFCDKVRLSEVFLNLISNAIKFNDRPKPRIEIGWNDRGDFHEFYVNDNGIGIKKEYFDKIFEIFQRLGKREEAEGTGAGLTIVKAIVQMHKGNIWLESKVDEGTTFYFTIPKDKSIILGKKLIGEILLEKKLVTEEELKKALEEQQNISTANKGGQNDGVT